MTFELDVRNLGPLLTRTRQQLCWQGGGHFSIIIISCAVKCSYVYLGQSINLKLIKCGLCVIIIQSLYYLLFFFLQILCFLFLWIVAHLQEWNELFVGAKNNDHQHPEVILPARWSCQSRHEDWARVASSTNSHWPSVTLGKWWTKHRSTRLGSSSLVWSSRYSVRRLGGWPILTGTGRSLTKRPACSCMERA